MFCIARGSMSNTNRYFLCTNIARRDALFLCASSSHLLLCTSNLVAHAMMSVLASPLLHDKIRRRCAPSRIITVTPPQSIYHQPFFQDQHRCLKLPASAVQFLPRQCFRLATVLSRYRVFAKSYLLPLSTEFHVCTCLILSSNSFLSPLPFLPLLRILPFFYSTFITLWHLPPAEVGGTTLHPM